MTIRKQWFVGLSSVAVITFLMSIIIFSSALNYIFDKYTEDDYISERQTLIEITTEILSANQYSKSQIKAFLESQLIFPIIRIELTDDEGVLVASAENQSMLSNLDEPFDELILGTEQLVLTDGGEPIGTLDIVKNNAMPFLVLVTAYPKVILMSVISIIGVDVMTIWLLSLAMSRQMAKQRLLHDGIKDHEAMEAILKLKSHTQLLDEIVFRIQMPLERLKNHFEGNLRIDVNHDDHEIRECQKQIAIVSSLVENASNLIKNDIRENASMSEKFLLHDIIEQIVYCVGIQFEIKSLTVTIDGKDEVYIKSNIYKLCRILYNLLTNAYQYTSANGTVHVEYAAIDDEITICVSDSGYGISDEEQVHIFEMNYRGSAGQFVAGEGMGLYFVKKDVQSLNGNIHVRSKPTEGSSFLFSFPIS